MGDHELVRVDWQFARSTCTVCHKVLLAFFNSSSITNRLYVRHGKGMLQQGVLQQGVLQQGGFPDEG